MLDQGADVPAYRDMPPVVGASRRSSPAERAGFKSAIAILTRGRPRRHDLGRLRPAIGGKAPREVTLLVRSRRASAGAAGDVPTPQGKYEVGDIGVFPNTHPHVRVRSTPGDPAERPASRPATSSCGQRRGDQLRATAVGGDRQARRQADRRSLLRDGQPLGHPRSRRCSAATLGRIGIGISDEVKRIEPGRSRRSR